MRRPRQWGDRAMKRFRRLLALPLILAAVMMAGPARAGDIALLESLGFSEAGDVFAFQQSGVEDGSGFPYADIFFLDLKSDRFLEPSPIRVRLNEDGALVADAVAEARAAAADLFTKTMPDKRNGHVVLDNPPTDLSSNGKLARFAIAGEDKKWFWAEATIDGETVVVKSPDVPKPIAVRYGFTMNPAKANLYNKEGIPASPFRTDGW